MKRKFWSVLLCVCMALNALVLCARAEETWDISLTAENVTPTGMTLVITAISDSEKNNLTYGAPFWLEKRKGDAWERMPYVREVAFSCVGYGAIFADSITDEVHWDYMYDSLPAGQYRFAKEFELELANGETKESVYYAYFQIEDPHICASGDADAICDECDAVLEHECIYAQGSTQCSLCREWDPSVKLTDPDWGITLSVEDVTPTGMKLLIKQSGGSPTGDLEYGEDYHIEQFTDGAWQQVQPLETPAFLAMAYPLEPNTVAEETLNWEVVYGELSPGQYRIAKEFMDFRGPGDYNKAMFYAEFIITDSHTCHSEDGDMVCDVCLAEMEHQSKDANNDGRCDLCGQWDEYRVVGNADWLGSWDPAFEQGLMSRREDGIYIIIFEDVLPGSYEIKVTKNGTWDESWGIDGENFQFTVTEKTDVIVTFTLKDGGGTVSVRGRGSFGEEEEDQEMSAETDDRSVLPIMLTLTASLSAACLLFRRKKYL